MSDDKTTEEVAEEIKDAVKKADEWDKEKK